MSTQPPLEPSGIGTSQWLALASMLVLLVAVLVISAVGILGSAGGAIGGS